MIELFFIWLIAVGLPSPGNLFVQVRERLLRIAIFIKEQGFAAFTSRGKFDFKEDFKNQLNALLKEMKAKGEIQAITEKYIH